MKSAIRPIGIIIVSLFGFLVILSFYTERSHFEKTGKEMQTLVINKNYVLTDSTLNQVNDPVFIDIREPEKFTIQHKKEAINIPLPSLLNEENKALLKSNRSKIILAHDPIKAHETWMLLTQLGYPQFYVANPSENE